MTGAGGCVRGLYSGSGVHDREMSGSSAGLVAADNVDFLELYAGLLADILGLERTTSQVGEAVRWPAGYPAR